MSPFLNSKTPNPGPKLLAAYFRSGWAFLIPYLAAYLLYAWLRWPVNPTTDLLSTGLPSTFFSPPSLLPAPCSLLHLYWFLHGLHLLLATLALRFWWRGSGATVTGATDDDHKTADHTASSQPSTVPLRGNCPPSGMDRLWPAMPWLCLGLLFYIPGVYLEWPADPWEHLRRINEWHVLDIVTAHSSWSKSSYFIPYSLLSWSMGLRQLFWLDFYYTGICLLLCWQYYLLAQACGLGKRASMVFVILQALLFGNNIFSFYRYYGISSSIYAQLGAVALTRIALDAAKSPQLSLRLFFSLPSIGSSASPPDSRPTAYRPLTAGCLLLALIAFNHPQGLGIAALGIGAVIIWRLIEWKRTAFLWLILTALVANVLFLWLYPRPAILETYRAEGYLNAWYGFNILDYTSLAGGRMLSIVSVFGIVNFAAALILFRSNYVIAWLTIMPLAALSLPIVAAPLALALAGNGGDDGILAYQRMFLSIPTVLAAVCLVTLIREGKDIVNFWPLRKHSAVISPPDIFTRIPFAHQLAGGKEFWAFLLTCGVIIALNTTPSSVPYYNRYWNAIAVASNDLQLEDIFSKYEIVIQSAPNRPAPSIITTQVGTALLAAYFPDLIGLDQFRVIGMPAAASITKVLESLGFNKAVDPSHSTTSTEAVYRHMIDNDKNLISDPMARDPSGWLTFGDPPPQFVSGITNLPIASTALQNPIGEKCNVFTSEMIAVLPLDVFRLEMAVRQIRKTDATAYLAVAWYDLDRNLLNSNVTKPQGAGYPRGWVNGTFSYFGLVSQAPSTSWMTYRISFGLGEPVKIPPHARFLRVGVLLNYNADPSGLIQVTDVKLYHKEPPVICLAIPESSSVTSPSSQAAELSTHWSPQQVMVDRAGIKEIQGSAVGVASDSDR